MEPLKFVKAVGLMILLAFPVQGWSEDLSGDSTSENVPGYSMNAVTDHSSPYHTAFHQVQNPNYDEGSLWGENSRFNNPFDDLPAPDFKVGDIIVVKIKENFRSQEDIRYENTTESEVDFTVSGLWNNKIDKKVFGKNGDSIDYPNTGIQGTDDYQGETRGNRRSQLTLDIACTVKKILSDGRLLIEGRQARIIGRDRKNRVLSGTVNPEDVDPDTRSISSTMVADSQLRWEGQGPGENVSNPGFIHRILDYIPLF
jgi:flagellar basal body L-ring protein FlgH